MKKNISEKVVTFMKNHTFIVALILNVLFLLLTIVFCEIKYETSDDFIMSSIISGVYGGHPDPHLIYINILWGYILLPFYYIFPNMSWYLISFLLLQMISFTAITYILISKNDLKTGMFLGVFLIVFFTNDAYVLVQFTKVAALTMMSGSLLFLHSLFYHEEINRKECICGAILVIIGSMIRFNIVYIIGGFILIILLIQIVSLYYGNKKIKNKLLSKIFIRGFILISIVLCVKMIDTLAYDLDKDYAFFREYGKLRGSIVDRPDYGYDACAEEYQKIGLSENDYVLLRTWNFSDPDYYTLDLLKKVEDILDRNQKKLNLDKYHIKNMLNDRDYFQYPIIWGSVLLIVFTIVFNKRYWWIGILISIEGFAYLCYFAAIGKMVYRVEYAVILCTFLSILYFWKMRDNCTMYNYFDTNRIYTIFVIIFSIYNIPTYCLSGGAEWKTGEGYKEYIEENFFESWKYNPTRIRCSVYSDAAFSDLKKEIRENTTKYYFLSFNSTIQTTYFGDNPFFSNPGKDIINASYFSGVTINYPSVLNTMQEQGITNPMKSLVEPNIYLIDNIYQDRILQYLREHYYPNATFVPYKSVDGFSIWKFMKNEEN